MGQLKENNKLVEGALSLLISLLEEEKDSLITSREFIPNKEEEDLDKNSEDDISAFTEYEEDVKIFPIQPLKRSDTVKPLQEPLTKSRIAVEGYPFNEKTIEKVLFLSNQSPGFWCIREMQTFIEEIEGVESQKTLKSFRQNVHSWTHQKKIVSIKYGSNKLVFYGLRAWVEEESNGSWKIKSGLEPKNKFMRGLTYEDIQKIDVAWNGMQR